MRTLLVLALLVAGCDCNRGEGSGSADAISGSDSGSPVGSDANRIDVGAVTPGDCSDAARWVYVVDEDRTLIRFEPDSLTFTEIGRLDCSNRSTPFSMSVDRSARAWVLYQSGELFHASTSNAACTPTDFVRAQSNFELFGMGFAANAGGSGETLFVAGGPEGSVLSGRARLATIDTGTLELTPAGERLPGWPELTGTGAGELWAFFPDTVPARAAQLDKATGAPTRTFELDAIPFDTPRAWAFAFWGGRYYMFLQTASQRQTHVWRLTPETGEVEEVVPASGLTIVGAGVSTCAPTELI